MKFIQMDPSKPSGRRPRRSRPQARNPYPSLVPTSDPAPILPSPLPAPIAESASPPDINPSLNTISPLIEPMDIDTEPMPPTPTLGSVEPPVSQQSIIPSPVVDIDPESAPITNTDANDNFDGEGLGCEEADEEDVSPHSSLGTSATSCHLSVPKHIMEAFTLYKPLYLDRDPNNFPKLYNSHNSFWVPQTSPLLRN